MEFASANYEIKFIFKMYRNLAPAYREFICADGADRHFGRGRSCFERCHRHVGFEAISYSNNIYFKVLNLSFKIYKIIFLLKIKF